MTEPDRPTLALPACPLTGTPARRRVHGFATAPLMTMWRMAGAGDLSHLFAGCKQIGLYEAESGLFFFQPMAAGDADFYHKFYTRIGAHRQFNKHLETRVEFMRAAAYVEAGARVLDVGCGMGAFSAHLPHARYVGLDPFADSGAPAYVLRQQLVDHARENPGAYDVVTAFQVIEHVAQPKAFAELLVRLLRPGGVLIVCAPLHPSPLTDIPNFLLNAPPHHLTWWNPRAMQALAGVLGVEPLEVAELPPSPHAALVGWIHRFSFARSSRPPAERYFAHRWSWHLNLAFAYGLAWCADKWLPRTSLHQPIDVFMAARKGKTAPA